MTLKRLAIAAALMLAPLASMAGEEAPEAKEKKEQTICPAMNNKINKKLFVDVKGKRIYVCCPPCKKKIAADPDKYIKILEDSGVTIEDAPKAEEVKSKP